MLFKIEYHKSRWSKWTFDQDRKFRCSGTEEVFFRPHEIEVTMNEKYRMADRKEVNILRVTWNPTSWVSCFKWGSVEFFANFLDHANRYTTNGILHMLDRNRRIKPRPERFQACEEKFDIIVSCEERVYDQILEGELFRTMVSMTDSNYRPQQ